MLHIGKNPGESFCAGSGGHASRRETRLRLLHRPEKSPNYSEKIRNVLLIQRTRINTLARPPYPDRRCTPPVSHGGGRPVQTGIYARYMKPGRPNIRTLFGRYHRRKRVQPRSPFSDPRTQQPRE